MILFKRLRKINVIFRTNVLNKSLPLHCVTEKQIIKT